jgi:hypothetical protein
MFDLKVCSARAFRSALSAINNELSGSYPILKKGLLGQTKGQLASKKKANLTILKD